MFKPKISHIYLKFKRIKVRKKRGGVGGAGEVVSQPNET